MEQVEPVFKGNGDPWNIALVDNNSIVLDYLASYLGSLPQFNICWSMQGGHDAVNAYHRSIISATNAPDLIITDLSMRGMSGFELSATIRFEDDHTPILGFTSYMTQPYEVDAVKNGMQGLLLKGEIVPLVSAMQQLLMGEPIHRSNGDQYETPQKAYLRLHRQGKPAVINMSPNEQRVMELCAQGLSTRAIAHITGDSESTVKTYISRAMKKLNASSRAEAVAKWSQKTKF